MSTITKDLGVVTAYGYAVTKGYEGTEEEFAELMASYATVAEQAAQSATTATEKAEQAAQAVLDAVAAKEAAQAAQSAAQSAKTSAESAASSASTSATNAASSASTASTAASTASTAASTASTKASEAAASATSASGSATTAQAAQTAAETAQSKAEDAQEAAEQAADELSAEVAQIETNKNDIANLKSDLDTLDTKISVAVKEVDEETSTDTEMLSRSDFTAGIMSPNGTVKSSSAIGYLNTPIAVEPGETIRVTKYYYNSGGEIAGQTAGSFRACAFFADNTYTYTNNGFSTARDSFVVPDGVYYIQPSISGLMTGTYNYVKIHRVTYSVSYALSDELANTIASPKLQALNNGTLTTKDLANSYACAMPKTDLRMTVGMPEKWYKKCMCTPPTDFVFATYGYSTTEHFNKYTRFPNENSLSSVNGYYWRHYDPLLNLIDSYDGSAGLGGRRRVIAENLSDCSVLVIGDSTVDHDTMTGKMLSYFTEKGHTLTLLGTLVSNDNPLNRNEGRAGWTTAEYLANTIGSTYTNPFWNQNSSSFDFSYYMTQQDYAGVDFVVIQLGINDLYPNTSVGGGSPKETVWNNIKTMIDSILAYNASTKIILNLPTTPNADESQHRISEFMYRNAVVQYNAYAMSHALSEYTDAKVRCSYCHLILDPETEIRDNVHPTVAGYEKMALEVINQINCWQNGV